MYIILRILIILLIVLALLISKKILKVAIILAAAILLFIGIFGVRTHVRIYNLNGNELALKIRHTELYNGHNFTRFISHLTFEELKDKIQYQYKDAFVYEDSIYIVKDNTIYSVSKEQDVNRFGVKCGEYIASMSYLIVKENGKMYCVDFPRQILSDLDERETKATFEDISNFYKKFTNVTINDNKILINKDNEQNIISLDNNHINVQIK